MNDEIKKKKWTTTLSQECLDNIELLRFRNKFKYDNEVVEYLVKKEVDDEMAKDYKRSRRESRKNLY